VLLADHGVIAALFTPYGWRWVVDAHKDDGKRYIVQSDELLSAFLELERVTRGISPSLHKWK
jgi:hypothetical protein